MRYRAWILLALAGVGGIVLTNFGMLPPLDQSILLGSSIGLIVVGPASSLAMPKPRAPRLPPEVKLMRMVKVRTKEREVEREEVLDTFDTLLERVEGTEDRKVNERLAHSIDQSVVKLTKLYPVWDSEGRLRTYVLMQKIGESLSPKNADTYLDIAYRTLLARGAEATEISRVALSRKVERMYLDPRSELAHNLVGTLILMNRDDVQYAEAMVADAIHLWSDERFDRLLQDFAAIRQMSEKARREVEDMIGKEMAKARKAGDMDTILRAREIMDAVVHPVKELSALPR